MPDASHHTDGKDWDAASSGNPVRVSPFADLLGFDLVERSDGRAVVECTVMAAHANTRGIAHGGIMSALMDTACGGAVAYQPSCDGKPAVTLSLTVTYLHPAYVGDRLRAVAVRSGEPKRTLASQVEVRNQAGALLAVGLATMRLVG
jgi:acyl-CoA thioesterase